MSVFDRKKGKYNFGAIRPDKPPPSPRLELRAGGRDRKVDLRQYCSPIIDQGELPSCNACAIVSALELLVIRSGQRLVRRSPMFLWYNARKISGMHEKKVGLYASHAQAGVMAWGVCEEADWPYDERNMSREPPADVYKRGERFEAVQYARLGSTDEVKAVISKGLPVTFGCGMPMGYYDAARGHGQVPELGAVADGEPCAHAMLAVGYDDDSGRWLVKNSWGEGHGDKGYLHIPYTVLDKYVWHEDLWVIGELETTKDMRVTGASQRELLEHVRISGPSEMREGLRKLGEEIREDLDRKVADAKQSIRERLQAQERELEAKRKKD